MQLDRRIRHVLTALPCELEEEVEEGPIHSDSAQSTRWNNMPANMSEYLRKRPKKRCARSDAGKKK